MKLQILTTQGLVKSPPMINHKKNKTMTKSSTCKTRKKTSTCGDKPRAAKKRTKVAKTDGLSDLDKGESHVITDAEVQAIINEEEPTETVKKASKETTKVEEEKKEVNPLQNLTPYEFQVTVSVLPSVQNTKQVLQALEQDLAEQKNLSETVKQKLEVLKELNVKTEMGIWNSMAEKFGYDTLEAAQEAGVKLTVKSGHFVQAINA